MLPSVRSHAALKHVPRLRERQITPGERWVYSAGFNVSEPIRDTLRIDCELADLEYLARAGARVAILSHQGSQSAGTAQPLGFAAEYLQRRLGRRVSYVDDPLCAAAYDQVCQLSDGELALVGNTRMLAGEETGDAELARALARFGDNVAVGGFSKAHRAHASNVVILDYLPGFAADSLFNELNVLAPWAEQDDACYSVAVLGGLKREKIDLGFLNFARRYDFVLPGGAVLNALLAACGYDVGDSALGECAASARAAAALLHGDARAEIHVPREVVIAPRSAPAVSHARRVAIEDGVPRGYAIVDFVIERWAVDRLKRLRDGGRAVLAGPPALYSAGFREATDVVLSALAADHVRALLLGGDSAAELPWSDHVSSGGGSALLFLATGSCPVLSALTRREQRS